MAGETTQRVYGTGSNSSISGASTTQFRTDEWIKSALIEARKLVFFGDLADVKSMPKNMGKKLKQYHYLPMLDDLNVNDQGLDAAGAVIATTEYYITYPADMTVANASKAAAATAIEDCVGGTAVLDVTAGADDSGGTGFATLTIVAGSGMANRTAKYLNATKKNTVNALNLGVTVVQGSGNLYGSSKDVGTINGKLPALGEQGGRVNRVGMKRIELEGTFEKFGFFDEWTQESLDFDTDADLAMHVNRELLNGAYEITEDALQIDLLQSAGVVRYAGNATSNVTLGADDGVAVAATGEDLVSYNDLLRLSITLDNNRCPRQTQAFTGTRMVDTKTISGGRILYCGSELIPTLEAMVDLHGNQAYIKTHQYASGADILNGEQGSVGNFRVVVVPEMMKWAGAGAVAQDATVYATNGQYDVFPMLCVGEGSFATIGFQTDGKTVKFTIIAKKPGSETADRVDPYGETGFMSIKWYYGFLLQRAERIGLIKTLARM